MESESYLLPSPSSSPSSEIMSESPSLSDPQNASSPEEAVVDVVTPKSAEPPPSYVKLAMRNMVRKGSKSLFHFALTAAGLLFFLVGLAYLTR